MPPPWNGRGAVKRGEEVRNRGGRLPGAWSTGVCPIADDLTVRSWPCVLARLRVIAWREDKGCDPTMCACALAWLRTLGTVRPRSAGAPSTRSVADTTRRAPLSAHAADRQARLCGSSRTCPRTHWLLWGAAARRPLDQGTFRRESNKKKCLSLTDSFYPVENTLLRVQARRECSKLVLSRHFTTHRVILVPVNITHILEAQSGQLEETKKGSGDHSYLR